MMRRRIAAFAGFALLAAGFALFAAGIAAGEAADIYAKGSVICFECIGLG